MADINITERQAGDVTILDLDGKVTIGEGSVALRSTIRRVLGEGKSKLLLNLAQGLDYPVGQGIHGPRDHEVLRVVRHGVAKEIAEDRPRAQQVEERVDRHGFPYAANDRPGHRPLFAVVPTLKAARYARRFDEDRKIERRRGSISLFGDRQTFGRDFVDGGVVGHVAFRGQATRDAPFYPTNLEIERSHRTKGHRDEPPRDFGQVGRPQISRS